MSQTDMPTYVTTNPTPTNPYEPITTYPVEPIGFQLDFGMIGIILGILCVLLLLGFWYNRRLDESKGADKRTPIEKMISSEISLNKLTLIQMGVIFPAMFGLFVGLDILFDNIFVGILVIAITGLGTATPFLYAKDQYREKNRNRYRLEGFLWKKNGERIKYSFDNVSFGTEAMLSDAEIEKLCEETVYTPESFKATYLVPTKIGDEHLIYLILRRPLADTFEWVDGESWDYFGTINIKVDGLELREVATLPRVTDDPNDEDYSVNEHVPTLIAMWDASRSKECVGKIVPVDITNDTVLLGLTKQIGAENRFTAGELNSKEASLRAKNKGQEQLDILAESIGLQKAMEYERNKNRLTTFALQNNRWVLVGIGVLIVSAISYFFGHQSGFAEAVLQYIGGG